MKNKIEMDKIYTDLAELLVTPERFGAPVLAEVVELVQPTLFVVPTQNLGTLFD